MATATKVKPMAKSKVDAILKDLSHVQAEVEADGMVFDDSFAFEIAQNVIDDNPGLKEYIEQKIGASDYVGWLANQF